MHQHRFQHQLGSEPPSTTPALATDSFMACPVVLLQGWVGQPCPWEAVYHLAYERAQAVVRPSRVEHLERVISWN